MAGWLIGGLILVIGATAITLIWWRLGDTWADEEYKKFGHGGGRERRDAAPPKVIPSRPVSDAPADEAPDVIKTPERRAPDES